MVAVEVEVEVVVGVGVGVGVVVAVEVEVGVGMRATLRNQLAKRLVPGHAGKVGFAAMGTTSAGLWTEIILPEYAQCLVCRKVMEPGEHVMISPGRWVRHPDCRWG